MSDNSGMSDDSDSAEEKAKISQPVLNDFYTILLVQPGDTKTRTYSLFDSVDDCLDGICQMYKERMSQNHDVVLDKYDIKKLYDFIDELVDLCTFVYQKETKTYVPHSKAWTKNELYNKLSP